MFFLSKNIKSRFSTDTAGIIWAAPKAYTVAAFEGCMARLLAERGARVHQFLSEIHPKYWARCYFPVPRYGHVTSNIAESMNASLGDAIRKSTMLNILVEITNKLSLLYAKGFEAYSSDTKAYPVKLDAIIATNKRVVMTLEIIFNARSPHVQVQSEMRSTAFRIFNKVSLEC